MPYLAGRLIGVLIGTCDMRSTPAAISTSMLPDITACAAKCSACCDEPHWRPTEVSGTDSGSRLASTASRTMLPACSSIWPTQPMIMSSTSAGSQSVRAIGASSTCASRSAECQPDSLPLRRPSAGRTAATVKASTMSMRLAVE